MAIVQRQCVKTQNATLANNAQVIAALLVMRGNSRARHAPPDHTAQMGASANFALRASTKTKTE